MTDKSNTKIRKSKGNFYSRSHSQDSKSMFMHKKVIRMSVGLYLDFEDPKLVKVKAHKRIRNGKIEKVRSCVRGD